MEAAEPRMYRCYLKSRPGMYAQYEGEVDVWSDSGEQGSVFRSAVRKLRQTSFPERDESFWEMKSFHRIEI